MIHLVRPQKLYQATLILSILAIAGGVMVLAVTPRGIGVSPDSIAYIGAARNLAAGHGLTMPYGAVSDTPLTRFPPLYPWLIGVTGVTGIDPLHTARWLQAALFGIFIGLIGAMLYRYTARNLLLSALGLVALLVSPVTVSIALMAWSELLFLVLAFLGIWALVTFLENPQHTRIIGVSVLIGLAVLTRYAGIALILAGGLSLLLFSTAGTMRRLQTAIWFGLLSSLPLALWLLRNSVMGGDMTGRELAFHPFGYDLAIQTLVTVSGWLAIPGSAPGALKLGAVVGASLFILVGLRMLTSSRETAGRASFLVAVLAMFVVTYLFFLVLSISFVDANTPMDDRILAPIFVAGLMLVLFAVRGYWLRWGANRPMQIALAITAGILFTHSARLTWPILMESRHQGIGYAGVARQQAQIIPFVSQLPTAAPIYSNVPDGLYFLTGRRTLPLPAQMRATSQRVNPEYVAQVSTLRTQLATEGGFIVYLYNVGRASTEQAREVEALYSLEVVHQTTDGVIYGPSRVP